MSASRSEECTRILGELADGERRSADELLPLVYEELKAVARVQLQDERAGVTLHPTALVHEAFLRLIGTDDPGWSGRRHFFGAAARAMRRLLVDHARRRGRARRGGDRVRVDLSAVEPEAGLQQRNVLDMDEALRKLEDYDREKARIVELRFFAGLTTEQTARALEVSESTVEREWRFIRSWLHVRLRDET